MSREHFFSSLQHKFENYPSNVAIYSVQSYGNNFNVTKVLYKELQISISIISKWIETICSIKTLVGFNFDKFSSTSVVVILGIWKSQRAVAPLQILGARKEVKYYLTDDISLNGIADAKLISQLEIDGITLFLLENENEHYRLPSGSWDMCFGLTTSGSTGSPKLVKVPWSCILPNIYDLNEIFQFSQSDTIFLGAPPTFDPFFVELLCALTCGSSLLLSDKCHLKALTDSKGLMKTLPKITFLQITPSILSTLPDGGDFLLGLNSSLRILVLGGEKFPMQPLRRNGATRVFNIYGITEVSCWAFIHEVTDFSRVHLGRPLSGVSYCIQDEELVLVSSSRKCLVGNELPNDLPNVVHRRTGDIVQINDENHVNFVTRKDYVIKKFGTKVDIGKIQRLLMNVVELKDSIILALSNIMVWFLVLRNSTCSNTKVLNVDETETFRKIVYPLLEDIQKPDLIVELPGFPLNLHGKTDVAKLKSILSELISNGSCGNAEDIFHLAWGHAIQSGILPEKSFKECGGSSVLALSVISQLSAYGIDVPNNLMSYLLGDYTYQQCLALFSQCRKRKLSPPREHSVESVNLQIKWRFFMKKCVDASPTLVEWDGKKYIAIGSHSSQLSLVFCDSGQALWTVQLRDRIESRVSSTINGRLLVGCYDGCVYCLKTETGSILWKAQTEDMVKSTPKITLDELSVICGSYDKKVYRWDVKTGSLLASKQISNGSILSTPLCAKTRVYISTLDGICSSLIVDTLDIVWKKDLKNPVFSSPCFLKSENCIAFASVGGSVYCFNADTGDEEWRFQAGGNIFSGITAFQLNKKEFITFGCHDCCIYLLDDNGLLLWKIKLESPINGAPSYSEERIACASTKGTVYVLNTLGSVLHSIQLQAEVFSSPLLYGENIYVGCRDNNLICLFLPAR